MTGKKKKNNWYAYRLPSGISGVAADWLSCEKKVSGVAGARYRGFPSEQDARAWLTAGARYEVRSRKDLEPGIYFDAGTGRGDGVEISVTDETGKNLLPEALPRRAMNIFGKHRIDHRGATNNYGELLALSYALAIAEKRKERRIFGDSKLIISYWSRGHAKRNELPPETLRLIDDVTLRRADFEARGGTIGRISGDDNPADLGFHR